MIKKLKNAYIEMMLFRPLGDSKFSRLIGIGLSLNAWASHFILARFLYKSLINV